ncbi:hypothetical protein NX059_002001 [Plenodomus lindquistii]|nr:hypothetical protein NX059_002001 [Plenodomus lindquistii]
MDRSSSTPRVGRSDDVNSMTIRPANTMVCSSTTSVLENIVQLSRSELTSQCASRDITAREVRKAATPRLGSPVRYRHKQRILMHHLTERVASRYSTDHRCRTGTSRNNVWEA